MKITFLYNNYADNGLGCKSRAFDCYNNEDILSMVLWLSVTEALPEQPVSRKIHEVIVNGMHFKTDKYSNPSDWIQQIKIALKKEAK